MLHPSMSVPHPVLLPHARGLTDVSSTSERLQASEQEVQRLTAALHQAKTAHSNMHEELTTLGDQVPRCRNTYTHAL